MYGDVLTHKNIKYLYKDNFKWGLGIRQNCFKPKYRYVKTKNIKYQKISCYRAFDFAWSLDLTSPHLLQRLFYIKKLFLIHLKIVYSDCTIKKHYPNYSWSNSSTRLHRQGYGRFFDLWWNPVIVVRFCCSVEEFFTYYHIGKLLLQTEFCPYEKYALYVGLLTTFILLPIEV